MPYNRNTIQNNSFPTPWCLLRASRESFTCRPHLVVSPRVFYLVIPPLCPLLPPLLIFLHTHVPLTHADIFGTSIPRKDNMLTLLIRGGYDSPRQYPQRHPGLRTGEYIFPWSWTLTVMRLMCMDCLWVGEVILWRMVAVRFG